MEKIVRSREHGVGRFWSVVFLFLVVVDIGIAQMPDRTQPPTPGPTPEFKLARIQHYVLSNGLPVVLLEKHEVPLVQVDLLVRAGAVNDSRDKAGRASMTADMLTEGAGSRNALELADAIDYLGARLEASSGNHTCSVDLFTPLARLDSALGLMADVSLRPTFPKAELDRHVTERLTSLLQWRDDVAQLTSVMASRILYGDRHPYGIPMMGDEQTLRALTVADLQSFHQNFFHPNNATLIVVGDVSATAMLPRLEKTFGSWSAAPVPSQILPAIRQVSGRRLTLIDKPGAAQSEIAICRIGAPRSTDDFYALQVMNSILGGSFTSRLNNNLREQHGYSYGAGSRFDFRILPGPFLASAAVQTAVTDKALVEFMKELRGILDPIPETDIRRAKNYIALGFPGEFQSVGEIASQLGMMVAFGLQDSYFDSFVGTILAVPDKDVARVAKKYIDPENLAIVITGDRSQIEKGIRALNLGPVTLMTAEDVLGKAPELNRK